MENSPLDELDNSEGYRSRFTDAAFWSPYVIEVLRRHDLQPRGPVWVGTPGTCPTFLVGERWVVKFFGRLFDGAQSFAAEGEAAGIAARDPAIRAVALAGSGQLGGPGWPWPYLIFPFAQGSRIGSWREQISPAAMLRAAAELGEMIGRLHSLPLDGSTVFPNSHTPHQIFLAQRSSGIKARLRQWGSLPERLISEVDHFLPEAGDLIDSSRPPHLIHADLTGDHLLGTLEDGCWHTTALIDFGDARTGGLLYEMAALQLDLFHGDRRLLAAFFMGYGQPPPPQRLSLAAALLHQFDLFGSFAREIAQAESLPALAGQIFGAP